MVHKSIYIRYLQHWLKHFSVDDEHGAGNIIIVDGDKFLREPWQEVHEIFEDRLFEKFPVGISRTWFFWVLIEAYGRYRYAKMAENAFLFFLIY